MTGTTELRSIYSGPIRRALERLERGVANGYEPPTVGKNDTYRTFTSIADRNTWTDRPDGALAYTPEYGGTVWRWHAGLNKWLVQQVESWVNTNMNDAVAIPNTVETPATFFAPTGKNWVQGSAGRLRCQLPGPNLYQVSITCVTRGSTGGAYMQVALKIQNGTTVLNNTMAVQGIQYWTGLAINLVAAFGVGDDITVYGATDSSGSMWDSRSMVSAHFLGPKT